MLFGVYYKTSEKNLLFTMAANILEYAYTLPGGTSFFPGSQISSMAMYNVDGDDFHDVAMLYDIVKDQLIIQDFQKVYKIKSACRQNRTVFGVGSSLCTHHP
jgi:hypothetical protein